MPENTDEKKDWTESDRALAYMLFQVSITSGAKVGTTQRKLVARSRLVTRPHGSWSNKISNYIQADKFIRGETDKPVYTGGTEKEEFPKLDQLWKGDKSALVALASSEITIRDDEALSYFEEIGFPPNQLKRAAPVNFSQVTREDILAGISAYTKGERPEGYRDSIEYDLIHEEMLFPPKVVMGLAYLESTGEVITGAMFEGGKDTPCFKRFKELGFTVIPKLTTESKFMDTTTRLITSLASKPFIILAGGTGTGKTKCAIEVARKICRKQSDNNAADYEVVAVGADWTDTRPLLGYENILGASPSYTVPKALDLIIRASRNPDRPFFLILDEMNLSHVERYFSDFLSIMESKKIDTEASTIKLHANKDGMPSTDGNVEGKVEQRIQWPDNLFVIGTVNIDETTHMFSPKVLDRAHVIEFKPDEAQITAGLKASWEKTADTETADELKKESEKGIWTDALSGMLFKENRVMKLRKSVDIFNDKEDDKKVIEKRIMDAWRTLSKTRFIFSHRTAQETADYIFISHRLLKENSDLLGEPPALNDLVDLAFLQKILPKINGSTETLTVKADNKDPKAASKETTLLDVLISEFKKDAELTRCIQKLEEMKTTLEREHFVSFIQ
jgi:hypothetical protein